VEQRDTIIDIADRFAGPEPAPPSWIITFTMEGADT
jgi:hypothetical protein